VKKKKEKEKKEKKRKQYRPKGVSRSNRYKETTSCLEALYYYKKKHTISRRVQIYSRRELLNFYKGHCKDFYFFNMKADSHLLFYVKQTGKATFNMKKIIYSVRFAN